MLNACGAYQVRETLSASGPWSVAAATDHSGREVRLTMLQLPDTFPDADASRLMSAYQRSLAARATASAAPCLLAHIGGGVEQRTLYLVEAMPALPTVRKHITESGPWKAEQVIPFLHTLAASLDPFHAGGTAHGFLCPDNVFVDNGTVMVGGQIWSEVLAMLGEISPNAEVPDECFIAPEVRGGQPVGTHAEVFSAAALASYMLTGAPLAQGASQLKESVPGPLAAAINRSLDPNPNARHSGVKEMIVEVAVEQAISTPDAAETDSVPDGGDVPDWARELLRQTSARRAAGKPVVETVPVAPPEVKAPPAAPRPAQAAPVAAQAPPPTLAPPVARPEPIMAQRPVAPSPPPLVMPPPPTASPVFDWGEGRRGKAGVAPVLMGSLAVVLILVAIAFTLLR